MLFETKTFSNPWLSYRSSLTSTTGSSFIFVLIFLVYINIYGTAVAQSSSGEEGKNQNQDAFLFRHSNAHFSMVGYSQSDLSHLLKSEQRVVPEKEKYPDIVTLPEGLLGDYILLRNPKTSGFELMIVWKIHIDEEGRTTPVLDLLTKVPKQVLEQKMATIENAPAHFRSMLLLVGIEEAIENLVSVFGSER